MKQKYEVDLFSLEDNLAKVICTASNAGEIDRDTTKNLLFGMLALLLDHQRLNWLLTEATAEQLSALPEWSREAIDTAMERCEA